MSTGNRYQLKGNDTHVPVLSYGSSLGPGQPSANGTVAQASVNSAVESGGPTGGVQHRLEHLPPPMTRMIAALEHISQAVELLKHQENGALVTDLEAIRARMATEMAGHRFIETRQPLPQALAIESSDLDDGSNRFEDLLGAFAPDKQVITFRQLVLYLRSIGAVFKHNEHFFDIEDVLRLAIEHIPILVDWKHSTIRLTDLVRLHRRRSVLSASSSYPSPSPGSFSSSYTSTSTSTRTNMPEELSGLPQAAGSKVLTSTASQGPSAIGTSTSSNDSSTSSSHTHLTAKHKGRTSSADYAAPLRSPAGAPLSSTPMRVARSMPGTAGARTVHLPGDAQIRPTIAAHSDGSMLHSDASTSAGSRSSSNSESEQDMSDSDMSMASIPETRIRFNTADGGPILLQSPARSERSTLRSDASTSAGSRSRSSFKSESEQDLSTSNRDASTSAGSRSSIKSESEQDLSTSDTSMASVPETKPLFNTTDGGQSLLQTAANGNGSPPRATGATPSASTSVHATAFTTPATSAPATDEPASPLDNPPSSRKRRRSHQPGESEDVDYAAVEPRRSSRLAVKVAKKVTLAP